MHADRLRSNAVILRPASVADEFAGLSKEEREQRGKAQVSKDQKSEVKTRCVLIPV
jgi:hypothetical protein